MNSKEKIAKILLQAKAVNIFKNTPFKFTSGILSPIYVDNRILISHPKERDFIVKKFLDLIKEKNLKFDAVSGTATAAIPWAAFIAQKLKVPMVYVRAESATSWVYTRPGLKSHGRGKQVEGQIKKGSKVLIIEDLISSGGSAIKNKEAIIKECDAKVKNGIAIFNYNFKLSRDNFKKANLKFHFLINFEEFINFAQKVGDIKKEAKEEILKWNKDPMEWGKKYEKVIKL